MIKGVKTYGLTGNMGMGKSTVAKFFAEYSDVLVLDADAVNKIILQDPANYNALVAIVGEDVFESKKLSFPLLARKVFGDVSLLRKLENWGHPRIWAHISNEIERARDRIVFAIVEATLIYEKGNEGRFDGGIIVVYCDKAEQYRRLQENRKLTVAEIEKRLANQMPIEEKIARANFTIDTSNSLADVEAQVAKLYARL